METLKFKSDVDNEYYRQKARKMIEEERADILQHKAEEDAKRSADFHLSEELEGTKEDEKSSPFCNLLE